MTDRHLHNETRVPLYARGLIVKCYPGSLSGYILHAGPELTDFEKEISCFKNGNRERCYSFIRFLWNDLSPNEKNQLSQRKRFYVPENRVKHENFSDLEGCQVEMMYLGGGTEDKSLELRILPLIKYEFKSSKSVKKIIAELKQKENDRLFVYIPRLSEIPEKKNRILLQKGYSSILGEVDPNIVQKEKVQVLKFDWWAESKHRLCNSDIECRQGRLDAAVQEIYMSIYCCIIKAIEVWAEQQVPRLVSNKEVKDFINRYRFCNNEAGILAQAGKELIEDIYKKKYQYVDAWKKTAFLLNYFVDLSPESEGLVKIQIPNNKMLSNPWLGS